MVSIAIALDTGKQFEIIYFIWKGTTQWVTRVES